MSSKESSSVKGSVNRRKDVTVTMTLWWRYDDVGIITEKTGTARQKDDDVITVYQLMGSE